jgi:alkanesulfonate monooxygenase SsuD/methylene tetrahydromethanopterin reductase-like flavin-dependent oxidoreductase (luciferase family)
MAPCCRAERQRISCSRRCWPSRRGGTGLLVWEAAYGVDAWSLLAAIAARTTRIRLARCSRRCRGAARGRSPARWRPLDQLSGGRAILAAGVGAIATDLPDTGEVTELRARAERMDEGIDLRQGQTEATAGTTGTRPDGPT